MVSGATNMMSSGGEWWDEPARARSPALDVAAPAPMHRAYGALGSEAGVGGELAQPMQRLALELAAPFDAHPQAGGDLGVGVRAIPDEAVAAQQHIAVAWWQQAEHRPH